MINPTGKKLEKLIFGIFDDASQGVDRYNHNGSLWLIFTNEMTWVVEYTKDQTLWYNYNLFKDGMELIGLDCVKNKDLIKKWFESRFLGIPKVEDSCEPFFNQDQYVEDTIQNGVKHTLLTLTSSANPVEDTIQNGVKHTGMVAQYQLQQVEDTIQNGVKHTFEDQLAGHHLVEDAIQNGVKHTTPDASTIVYAVEDTVQNGVKHTEDGDWLDCDERFNNIIQEGVKETHVFIDKLLNFIG